MHVFISATTSTQLVLMHWNHNWRSWNPHRRLYHNQIEWFPFSCKTKSYQELHTHTVYDCWRL